MNTISLIGIVFLMLAAFTALGVLAWSCLSARPPQPRPAERPANPNRLDWDWPSAPQTRGNVVPLHTARCSRAHPYLKSVSDTTDAA